MVILCAVIGLFWLVDFPWKAVCLICVVFYTLPVVKRHLSDPYFVDFHTELNSQGDASEQGTRTEWINMGYWRVRIYIKLLTLTNNAILFRIPTNSQEHAKVSNNV